MSGVCPPPPKAKICHGVVTQKDPSTVPAVTDHSCSGHHHQSLVTPAAPARKAHTRERGTTESPKLLENFLACLPALPLLWRALAMSGMAMSRWTIGLQLRLPAPPSEHDLTVHSVRETSWPFFAEIQQELCHPSTRLLFLTCRLGALEKPTSCRWPTGLHRKEEPISDDLESLGIQTINHTQVEISDEDVHHHSRTRFAADAKPRRPNTPETAHADL